MVDPPSLPSGTVAFLFTDIEGSTARWERDRGAMGTSVNRMLALLRGCSAAHHGALFKVIGDGTQSAFRTVPDAVAAAVEAQQALRAEPWPAPVETVPVRMAVHVGAAEPRDGDYLAPCLNRLGRLLDAGHGGQVLLSAAAADMAREWLPPDVTLRDLGAHRLRDLAEAEHIYAVGHPALPRDFPPLRTLDRVLHNLPVQPTPFIGRKQEVEHLVALLREPASRLLTLTGPPGVGKTRLALQVAAELVDTFPDGVFFVALAPLAETGLVPAAIGAAVGAAEAPGQAVGDTLRACLADRHVLLVLDNFEHLLDAAPTVSDLLATCPRLVVLVTSRAPLHLRGEREVAVAPLTVPSAGDGPIDNPLDFDAVRLFAERATDVNDRFRVDEATARQVAEVCRRLDGLPLAIELAAARSKVLPPAALLHRLGQRLPVLGSGPRDAPARQRTLRDTIAWSYGLLDADRKRLFRRLAVFPGGCTLVSAEAVADHDHHLGLDVLDGLSALIDGSVVYRQEGSDGSSGEPRYAMLETIREFALEQLTNDGELDPAQAALRRFLTDLVERASQGLLGPEQEAWLGQIDSELANLRSELQRAVRSGDRDGALVLAAGLRHFWRMRGHYAEGRSWLTEVLAIAGDAAPALRATAHQGLGFLALDAGDYDEAQRHFAAALALREDADDLPGSAEPLRGLGLVALNRQEYDQAWDLHERALDASRAAEDRRAVALTLHNMGVIAREQGDLPRGRALYRESLALWRELGDRMWAAQCLLGLGIVSRLEGNPGQARGEVSESLAGSTRIGDQFGVGQANVQLGHLARETGDEASAARHYLRAAEAYRSVGATEGVLESVGWLAGVMRALGHPVLAVELFGMVDATRSRLGLPPMTPTDAAAIGRELDIAKQDAAEEWASAWSSGERMSVDHALSLATALPALRSVAEQPESLTRRDSWSAG